MDYPTPSHAAQVWMVGDKLAVAFPPLPGNDKGHTTTLPCTEDGIQVLRSILRSRAEGFDTAKAKIGTLGSPTQYNIDEIMRRMRAAGKEPRIEPFRDGSKITSLEEIGL